MMFPPSARAHLYVLEQARVYEKEGRVEYELKSNRGLKRFNIPIANTSFLLLGPDCSITQEAAMLLGRQGVCLGYCGAGGTPFISGERSPRFLFPATSNQDDSCMRRWFSICQSERRRLTAAKSLQITRAQNIADWWESFPINGPWPTPPRTALRDFERRIVKANTTEELLVASQTLSKALYKSAGKVTGFTSFERTPGAEPYSMDPNGLLDRGGYLADGLASSTLWSCDVPSDLSVLRADANPRGMIGDLADVIVDAVVLPIAFNFAARAGAENLTNADFQTACRQAFDVVRAPESLSEAMALAINEAEACES